MNPCHQDTIVTYRYLVVRIIAVILKGHIRKNNCLNSTLEVKEIQAGFKPVSLYCYSSDSHFSHKLVSWNWKLESELEMTTKLGSIEV